jgi:hypothetical protein
MEITKEQYLKQLKKWFNLTNNHLDFCLDNINQDDYDRYFDFIFTTTPIIQTPIVIEGKWVDGVKYAFIKYCYDNNLCEYDLDSAYTLWKLSVCIS